LNPHPEVEGTEGALPKMMRRAVFVGPGQITLETVPVPEPAPDQVLIEVRAVGLCTMEQRFYKGSGPYPFLGGHEIAGVVRARGSAVMSEAREGDLVTVAQLTRCGECYFCRRGLDHLCVHADDRPAEGVAWGPGGLADFILVRGYEVYRLSPEVRPEEGCLTEPLACCIRSMGRADIRFGDTVLVTGAGIMGLLHVKLAKLRGARVIVSEPSATRRSAAKAHGADLTVDPTTESMVDFVRAQTDGRGAEAVFYTAGGPRTVEDCIRATVKGGTVVLYGSTHPDPNVTLNANNVHYDEITVTGTYRQDRESFREAARLISLREVDLRPFVSAIVPLSELDRGFKLASDPGNYRVIVLPGAGE